MNQQEREQIQSFVKNLGEVITQMFGGFCEVAISQIEDGKPCISQIYNGHVTDRCVGDSITSNLEYMVNLDEEGVYINYSKYDRKRKKKFKSSTIMTHIGDMQFFFCINCDMDQFESARLFLDSILKTTADQSEIALFEELTTDSMSDVIEQTLASIEKPVHKFTRSDKLLAIQLLKNRGIFSIKKSIPTIAQRLGISRTTLYNYLKQVD